MEIDTRYMKRAIELARHAGLANTSPNPMVGAVIVRDGMIIGEGYHRRCGEGHAEVNAIASVSDPELLKDSTIYVTLEPCSHYGKTPPCSQLIIDKGLPRVVVGSLDPYEKVSGRGVKMLRDAGIEVTTGVLEEECRAVNPVFMTAHSLRRLGNAEMGPERRRLHRQASRPVAAARTAVDTAHRHAHAPSAHNA